MDNARYIIFPLSLLRELHSSPRDTTDRAIDYGIVKMGESLTDRTIDNPTERKKDAVSKSMHSLGITGDIDAIIRGAKNTIVLPEEPMVMVSVDLLFRVRDMENPDEQYLTEFAAYCGIKSMLGKGRWYIRTNKMMVHARMFGYKSPREEIPDGHALIEKYRKRYHLDLILDALEADWGIKRVPVFKGFILSASDRLSYEDLYRIRANQAVEEKMEKIRKEKMVASLSVAGRGNGQRPEAGRLIDPRIVPLADQLMIN